MHMENRVSSRVQWVTGHGFEGFWATGLRGSTGLRRKSTGTAKNCVRLHHRRIGSHGFSGLLALPIVDPPVESVGTRITDVDLWRIGLPLVTGSPVHSLSGYISLSGSVSSLCLRLNLRFPLSRSLNLTLSSLSLSLSVFGEKQKNKTKEEERSEEK
jgi:hypothetical protein